MEMMEMMENGCKWICITDSQEKIGLAQMENDEMVYLNCPVVNTCSSLYM